MAELFFNHPDFSLKSPLANDYSLFPTTTFTCMQILLYSVLNVENYIAIKT